MHAATKPKMKARAVHTNPTAALLGLTLNSAANPDKTTIAPPFRRNPLFIACSANLVDDRLFRKSGGCVVVHSQVFHLRS
jgi:hypothetical protein